MIKKLGLLALTTGMLFSGGAGVSAAETSQTLKAHSIKLNRSQKAWPIPL